MTELAEVEIKYRFPLFSKPSSLVNLKNCNIRYLGVLGLCYKKDEQ